jgi:hypothetical protein
LRSGPALAQSAAMPDTKRAGSTAIDIRNDSTGFVSRSVVGGLLARTFGGTFATPSGTKYTFTVTVYKANGKVVASQTKSATAL